MRLRLKSCAASLLLAWTATSYADVMISSGTTQNMSCSGGVCAPTATSAVLNVNDLETLLASGNVTVTTTGSGGVQADNIDVSAALSWSNGSALALQAFDSIAVSQTVSVTGSGGLALTVNNGGSGGMLSFGTGGNVTFANSGSVLSINGATYTLVDNIATLASDISGNPGGYYALANNYDASGDGTYTTSPVTTPFSGNFEGLGNSISNLTINDPSDELVGLFAEISRGTVRDIGIQNANVTASAEIAAVGALAGGDVSGQIAGAYSTGTVTVADSNSAEVGGLVGGTSAYPHTEFTISNSYSTATVSGGTDSYTGGVVGGAGSKGLIYNCYATGQVSGGVGSFVGGLAGWNDGAIENSFASGTVMTGNAGQFAAYAGGLVGGDDGAPHVQGVILNSYSLGNVVGGQNDYVGGLVGYGYGGKIKKAYSTGEVTAGTGSFIGGFIGYVDPKNGFRPTSFSDAYWDTDSSGITNLSQGAGNIANVQGIAGLSTTQLRARLPKGFSKSVWSENSNINGGLPYLIANPPVKQ